jgi:phage gp29-like protein
MPGTFMKTILGMMTALDYGYSISEIVLKYLENGKHKGKIGLKAIKSRKPHDFEFQTDEHSNLKHLIQYQGGHQKELPPEKFVIWSWNPEWENWYGVSDLKAAYRPWWMKDVVTKFHGIFLERYPSPVFIGRYPQGLAEKEKKALLIALEDLQIKTSTIVPQGVIIDTIEVGKSGSAIYDKAIEKFDKQICRSVLVPDLLGMSNTPSKGSYALGRKHFDVFLWVLYHLGKTVEEMLHEQLTIPLIDLNFQVDEYPKFIMEEITEESMETKAKILVQLSQAGLVDFTIPAYRKWASEFLYALPDVDTKANEMAHDAVTFSDQRYKFCSPDGRDSFMLDIEENTARMEKFEDALLLG